MKPFLGIDITTNKKNEEPNGKEFLVATPTAMATQSLERSSRQLDGLVADAQLPRFWKIAQWVCGIVGVVIVGGIFKATGDISLAEGYQNAAWLYWLGGICWVIFGILTFLGHKKQKTVLQSDESTAALSHLEGRIDAVFEELSVPADAIEVELLSFFYKEKDGNIKVYEKGLQVAPYINLVFKAYADTEHLYVASMEEKYAFPLRDLVAIRTVKKAIRILEWSKEEEHDSALYKKYKLSLDNYDCICCKYYHILEVRREGISYGIYIPCYELPLMEELMGLKAEEGK